MAEESMTEQQIIEVISNYKSEAELAKQERMEKNRQNFDAYHLKQDFSHKTDGQSQEFLPKQSMATEQAANFIQQGLIDLGDWFSTGPAPGLDENEMRVKPSEVRRLLQCQLDYNNINTKVGDALKLGFLGSLMIAKVGGYYKTKPKYVVKEVRKKDSFQKILEKVENKSWCLDIQLVRQEDYFPDPTGSGLYEIERTFMDFHEIEAMSKGKYAVYDPEAIALLKKEGATSSTVEDFKKSRETGQNSTSGSSFRKRIEIWEFWGNIVNHQGELIYENVTCTIANRKILLQKPTPNPFWHQESPFVVKAVISVPFGVWGRALMDAPTQINKAYNEIFNLTLDNALSSVHGIKQVRETWLDDASQIENGIPPGTTLKVGSNCPPGMKVLERIDAADSGGISAGLQMMNVVAQEGNAAAMTNDLRQGVQSFRAVKATEVLSADQSITGMFTGISKNIEADWLTKLLMKSWKLQAQNFKEIDKEEVISCVGKARGEVLTKLSGAEMFAETVNGCDFRVFGVSATLNKQKDFTKLTAYLQTISANESLTEAFIQSGGDFGKLNMEIARSLDLDPDKITSTPEEQLEQRAKQGPPMAAPQGVPDQQSQIPQAGAAGNQAEMSAQSAVQPGPPQ